MERPAPTPKAVRSNRIGRTRKPTVSQETVVFVILLPQINRYRGGRIRLV